MPLLFCQPAESAELSLAEPLFAFVAGRPAVPLLLFAPLLGGLMVTDRAAGNGTSCRRYPRRWCLMVVGNAQRDTIFVQQIQYIIALPAPMTKLKRIASLRRKQPQERGEARAVLSNCGGC
jgi:hypothetical protein